VDGGSDEEGGKGTDESEMDFLKTLSAEQKLKLLK